MVIQSVSLIIMSCFSACSPGLVQVSAFSALLALVWHFISFLDKRYYPDKLLSADSSRGTIRTRAQRYIYLYIFGTDMHDYTD